jgi:hypothetical protein
VADVNGDDVPDVNADSWYGGCSIAQSLRGLVVTGKQRVKPERGFAVRLLDQRTGETLKRADVRTSRSIHQTHLLVSGKLLAVADDGLLYGFDPETWTVGREH